MIKANGWDNHEDTFEEALRRELVAARETIFVLQDDIKELITLLSPSPIQLTTILDIFFSKVSSIY